MQLYKIGHICTAKNKQTNRTAQNRYEYKPGAGG